MLGGEQYQNIMAYFILEFNSESACTIIRLQFEVDLCDTHITKCSCPLSQAESIECNKCMQKLLDCS